MAREAQVNQAAVGFRVKSGWATAVLLVSPGQTPQVLSRHVVDLSAPDVPESRQPYHAAMGKLEQDDAKIQRRTEIVKRVTARSVTALLEQFQAAGHPAGSAGLVVGSQIDPASIANPHIRAHALEGQLFRSVLVNALKAHGVPSVVVVERDAYHVAAARLGRPERDLKRVLTDLGRSLGGPWRAEEKLAALAAWIALA